MSRPLNCWEALQCGREPGGAHSSELGVCPAASATAADGFAGGVNGGRGCAYIAGTFCGGAIQGTVKDKAKHCEACHFYRDLRRDHPGTMTVLSFGRYVRDHDDRR